MAPGEALPLPQAHRDTESYVEALLAFITSSEMLQTLCGGLHILDFMTMTPDHYEVILPGDWRQWLQSVDILDFHDLLMRENVQALTLAESNVSWRGYPPPPQSILEYILSIRNLLLNRSFSLSSAASLPSLSREISVGMKVKKVHEVENFASFVNELSLNVNYHISHLVDFGSGQAYLGRALAGPLYKKQIVAIESKPHNIEGARNMDVGAKLIEKPIVWRNKKKYRTTGVDDSTDPRSKSSQDTGEICGGQDVRSVDGNMGKKSLLPDQCGKIQYVEHRIVNGDLENVIDQIDVNVQVSIAPSSMF